MQNEELPWERKERLQDLVDKEGGDLPFAVYLVASAIVAIAAVSSPPQMTFAWNVST